MARAWVGLGSNQDGPRRQLERAVDALDALAGTRLQRHSSLYRSPPLQGPGVPPQPHYLNAVAELETGLQGLELLDGLLEIEARHGRRRGVKWGPRTLDLDVLLYGDGEIDHPRLRVPHPELHRRPFVLYPLAELDEGLTVPGLGRLGDLLPPVDSSELERLARPVAGAERWEACAATPRED